MPAPSNTNLSNLREVADVKKETENLALTAKLNELDTGAGSALQDRARGAREGAGGQLRQGARGARTGRAPDTTPPLNSSRDHAHRCLRQPTCAQPSPRVGEPPAR